MSERQVVRTWNVLGTEYQCVKAKIDSADEGECDPSSGELRVSDEVAEHRVWEVESHELGHLVAHVMGMQRMLRDVFGLSSDVASRIEEEWLAKFLPVYLDTLERSKILKAPRGVR